jgi:hypothetical protein
MNQGTKVLVEVTCKKELTPMWEVILVAGFCTDGTLVWMVGNYKITAESRLAEPQI